MSLVLIFGINQEEGLMSRNLNIEMVCPLRDDDDDDNYLLLLLIMESRLFVY